MNELTLVCGTADFQVRKMTGYESISGLFTFHLELFHKADEPLSPEVIRREMLAVMPLAFDHGQGPTPPESWLGFVRSLTYVARGDKRGFHYRAEMVAYPWLSSLFRRSRVFQDRTVPQILEDVLKDIGYKYGNGVETRLTGTYPSREYTVQHEETDWAFVSRLLEHEGIFHYYDAGPGVWVLADDNAAFEHLDGHEFIKLTSDLDDPGISDLSWEHDTVTKHAVLRDYDWRQPGSIVQADAEADAPGFGIDIRFGEHTKADDAKRLAPIRAQELTFPHQKIRATTNIPSLRPGHRFTLEAPASYGAFLDGQELVVASAKYSIVQGRDDGAKPQPFRAELELFPYTVPYRPQRKTPIPRIDGLVYAIVDGESASTAAPIDDQGRYRLYFPYDTTAKTGGRATRWVRMAQPYAGAGYGMHFPLHIGTQVMVAHVNGDPDRPVIVGAIPNAATTSPVASANATQSAIRSHNGIVFELEDDA